MIRNCVVCLQDLMMSPKICHLSQQAEDMNSGSAVVVRVQRLKN